MMNLRELLFRDFGYEYEISGGFGNSIENPIIIHRTRINDYVGTEYSILKCLGEGRRITWKLLNQGVGSHNGRTIDKLKIETVQLTETEIITQVENYYFDITECMGPDPNASPDFNEEETLNNIIDRLREMETESDRNKYFIDLLREGILFDDSKIGSQFLIIILDDKSMPLYEMMMTNRRRAIIDVLELVSKRV